MPEATVPPRIELRAPATPDEWYDAAALVREYFDGLEDAHDPLEIERELALLPAECNEPRGAMLLAWVDGALAGCCALRPLDSSDYSNASEMRRLYVRRAFRGFGLGRQLAEAKLDLARRAGYACVLLDTYDAMEAARALYAELGFVEIPPYYHHPLAGTHPLKVDI